MGIVRITGGTQFGHNPIGVVKKMVKVRDRRGNDVRKDLKYIGKVDVFKSKIICLNEKKNYFKL